MRCAMKKQLAIAVPLSDAEKVRTYLQKQQLLEPHYRLHKDTTTIYFPVKTIPNKLQSYPHSYRFFEEKKQKITSYQQRLHLPAALQEKLPTSYDIIGRILLIKIPQELKKYENKIGAALLRQHKHVETVYAIEPVRGELRLRSIKNIAGTQQTITQHKEQGLSFFVDVEKTYFSPRLAGERKRITSLVQPGETIVDLFAGVAPFACMIAKYAHPKQVYAVDKNIDAVQLAKKNSIQNKLVDRVEVIHADAEDIPMLFKKKKISADRVIMNLPFESQYFFTTALQLLKDQGVIHLYTITKEETLDHVVDDLKKQAQNSRFLFTDVKVHKIKTYATREFYIALDITATKMPT